MQTALFSGKGPARTMFKNLPFGKVFKLNPSHFDVGVISNFSVRVKCGHNFSAYQ